MINPYQSPFPDEFKDEKTQQYEAAIEAHEKLVNGLRDRIGQLEAENELLKWVVGDACGVLVSHRISGRRLTKE